MDTQNIDMKNALHVCQMFCDGMKIDTQDLNPWCPVSEPPKYNRPCNPPILIADEIAEHMCVGIYDGVGKRFLDSNGNMFEDAVWWKHIQDVPLREGSDKNEN